MENIKTRVFLTLLLALVLGAGPVWAAAATSTAPGQQIRETYQERKQEFQAERGAIVQEVKRERAQAFMDQMIARLNAALARNQNFIDRIKQHLAERAARGQDVTQINAVLAEAEALIAAGRSQVSQIRPAVETAWAATTTKSSLAVVQQVVKEAVAAVKQSHQKIVEAVRLIRNLPLLGDNNNAENTAN